MIKNIENIEEWNKFIQDNAPRSGAFLHSWDWGEFQKAAGKTVHRFGLYDDDYLTAVAQVFEMQLKMGKTYLYCPRGPIIRTRPVDDTEVRDTLSYGSEERDIERGDVSMGRFIKMITDKAGAVFTRFEPIEAIESKEWRIRKVKDKDPANTLILNLEPDQKMLLAKMHHKTRYNIRLAEKKGVTVSIGQQFTDEVWSLFETTATRGQFRLHGRDYYETMLKTLINKPCHAFLAVAEYENTPVAANIMIDYGTTRTYLHGASGKQHRNVMAPFLLHWEMIKSTKDMKISEYDWWGVAPEGADENHPWAGITRFKQSFGGDRINYPGTFDLIASPVWYNLYLMAKKGLGK